MAQHGLEDGSRRSLKASKMAQDIFKMGQGGSKTANHDLKTAQEASEGPKGLPKNPCESLK
eukprot:4583145-Pyramimonas_sp.AAC.1